MRGAGAVLLLALPLACAAPPPAGLSPEDEQALRELEDAYTAAWRANDPEAVMATLVPDEPVLLPDGMEPLVGAEEVRAFWWPEDGGVTTVTDYRTTIDGVDGSGDMAYLRGHGDLSFTWRAPDGATSEHRSRSTFLMVARRGEDGRWRIARRMWSNLGS